MPRGRRSERNEGKITVSHFLAARARLGEIHISTFPHIHVGSWIFFQIRRHLLAGFLSSYKIFHFSSRFLPKSILTICIFENFFVSLHAILRATQENITFMPQNIQQREELHKTIWAIANSLRGAIDGWEFKSYVLCSIFYRFISENMQHYIDHLQELAGVKGFDYSQLDDKIAESVRTQMVQEKGYFILPSQLFCNVCKTARKDENLNLSLQNTFRAIEASAQGFAGPVKVLVTFTDDGKPFDPLTAKEPDIDVPFDDRPIGGLGMFIVRNTMDNLSYENKNGQNILIAKKKL